MINFIIGFILGGIVTLFSYCLILVNKFNEKEVNKND